VPREFGKEARKIWERLAPMLDGAGLPARGQAKAFGNLLCLRDAAETKAELDKPGCS
jgi:hypothetical protein